MCSFTCSTHSIVVLFVCLFVFVFVCLFCFFLSLHSLQALALAAHRLRALTRVERQLVELRELLEHRERALELAQQQLADRCEQQQQQPQHDDGEALRGELSRLDVRESRC